MRGGVGRSGRLAEERRRGRKGRGRKKRKERGEERKGWEEQNGEEWLCEIVRGGKSEGGR